jgi:type IV pilus assembly protein PilV
MRRQLRSGQQGVMLLEALIGLLIFSLGILALVALQSVSISNVSNAKFRVEAAFAAEEIMNRMWVDSGVQLANVQNYRYPGGNAPYLMAWLGRLQGSQGLPGTMTYPPIIQVLPSTITVQQAPDPLVIQQVREVRVTIRWKAPDALAPSNHTAIGWITEN